jgi:TPR repeat protein
MSGRGEGVPQDFKEVVRWYRLSAEQGHVNAQYNLGVMYRNGLGVSRDHVLAHMWWSISGFNGDEEGVKKKNIAEKRMTQLQIEEAQRLARNWKPTTSTLSISMVFSPYE